MNNRRMNTGIVQGLAIASQLAFIMAAAVVIGILGGNFLDSKLGTAPLFLIAGSLLGAAAGIYGIAKTTKFLLEKFGQKPDKTGG